MSAPVDPRRSEKVIPYKAPQNAGQSTSGGDDFMPDYMNILGMIFSMCGLMMKLKWCGKHFFVMLEDFFFNLIESISINRSLACTLLFLHQLREFESQRRRETGTCYR